MFLFARCLFVFYSHATKRTRWLASPIGHKKRGRALGPASVVCSQFGKLTKLLLGAYKCRILI